MIIFARVACLFIYAIMGLPADKYVNILDGKATFSRPLASVAIHASEFNNKRLNSSRGC